ncbi:AAA family ATPase [Neolewinella litorea]|uniref:EVE domain-containing protein n=1 Tax=Neolewinella litorea TaxID=2562452 RepID=A0A4S4NBY4_9BACT|nr:AAA family ATPase [Neolewinella litorea]THH35548.1 EVE domain-containing protein [Neolewinella litorea]
MTDPNYSWVLTHKEIVEYLRTKEDSQQELINLLKSVGISPFNDKAADGDHTIELEEIDPFTFFCYIYKYGFKKRLEKLQQIAGKLGIEMPMGESGLPSAQPQKVWLFPYKYMRNNNEVGRLWDFFRKELNDQLTDADFADVLKIRGAGRTKLTEALFYINPEKNLPIDGPSKPYLKQVLGINPNFKTYSEYREIINQVKEHVDMPFYQLSYEAWKWTQNGKQVNHWIFQGNPNVFDFESALRDDLVTNWTVSAHKDKISPGDKAILWITGENAGCYALAEVSSVPYHKEPSGDDHLWKQQDKSKLKVDIRITHNLVNDPVLKKDIVAHEELQNLKVGNQGTNFSATEAEYEAIVELISNDSTFFQLKERFVSADLETYMDYLRRFIDELELQPSDDRVVFSIKRRRLNFIIGQRYCFNLYLNDPRGVFGVISKEKLWDHSQPFDGKPPQPFYTYFQDFSLDEGQFISVIAGMRDELDRTNKSGFKKYDNADFESYVFGMESKVVESDERMDFPLNTILYGPPGTGKTYHTILRAAEIVAGRKISEYSEALRLFNENLHSQIEFITFHQNYSYEDFIQGLRPDTENEKELTFQRKDGVFKEIADRALKNIKASEQPQTPKKTFQEAFNEFVNPLVEGEVEEVKVKMKKVSYFITAITTKSIEFRKSNGNTAHTLSIATLGKMYDAESVLDIQGLSSYYAPLLDKLLKIGKDQTGRKDIVKRKNYVIIIDEINRANISRVFGELITLIEPDKRSHGDIPMEAKLPSGDTFVVPSNLYIIGTMNTADKSIALLDIALRRRFEFEAMYPQYDIPGREIYDVGILEELNKQIVKSKGHDFQIGHSYFMGENRDLVRRMNKKVIPLLLEYYMNDEKEVRGILQSAGLRIEENSWPLKISGKND